MQYFYIPEQIRYEYPRRAEEGGGALEFSFSADRNIKIERLGEEEQPVVIIDNALGDPDAFVANAAIQTYGKIGPYYPGMRAPLPAQFNEGFCAAIAPIIAKNFSIETEHWRGECFYSLVTTPPERLAPIQRLPHYDGVEQNRMAALIYLCPEYFGGTAFYRHKSTGFETVTADRFNQFRQALEQEVREVGLPSAHYIGNGAPLFERTRLIDAALNRMLIYRGVNLHCSAIDNNAPLPADPKHGRLTITAFLMPAP